MRAMGVWERRGQVMDVVVKISGTPNPIGHINEISHIAGK